MISQSLQSQYTTWMGNKSEHVHRVYFIQSVYNNELINNHVLKSLIHEGLEYCRCIRKPKRHDQILIMACVGDEGSLRTRMRMLALR